MSDDAKIVETGVDEARIDALLDCKVGDLPGLLLEWVDKKEISADRAATLFCNTLHSVLLAFVSAFAADKRKGVAVGLIMRISRTVLAADELKGGAREKSLH